MMNFVMFTVSLLFDNVLTLSLRVALLYYVAYYRYILSFFLTYRSMKKKWYAVYIGSLPGVYDEWSECQAQVNRFPGSSYKGFQSKSDAEASYLRFTVVDVERKKNRLKNYLVLAFFFIAMALFLYSNIL